MFEFHTQRIAASTPSNRVVERKSLGMGLVCGLLLTFPTLSVAGDRFQVDQGVFSEGEVAAINPTHYVVAWTSTPSHPTSQAVFQIFVNDENGVGQPIGKRVSLGDPLGSNFRPRVTALGNNTFVACWTTSVDWRIRTFSQVFNAAGEALAPADPMENVFFMGRPAALPNGGYVVAGIGLGTSGLSVWVQRFKAGGQKLGSALEVAPWVLSMDFRDPVVTGFSDGGFAVVYAGKPQNTEASYYGDIFARLYDANGGFQTEIAVHPSTEGNERNPSVSSLGKGEQEGFVVTWQSDNYDIYAKRYDRLGNAREAEFLVSSDDLPRETRSAVIGTPDGEFSVVWASWRWLGEIHHEFFDGSLQRRVTQPRLDAAAAGQGYLDWAQLDLLSQQTADLVLRDSLGTERLRVPFQLSEFVAVYGQYISRSDTKLLSRSYRIASRFQGTALSPAAQSFVQGFLSDDPSEKQQAADALLRLIPAGVGGSVKIERN